MIVERAVRLIPKTLCECLYTVVSCYKKLKRGSDSSRVGFYPRPLASLEIEIDSLRKRDFCIGQPTSLAVLFFGHLRRRKNFFTVQARHYALYTRLQESTVFTNINYLTRSKDQLPAV